MDDLDSLFAGELASIDQVFQEFEIKDKKTEQRNQMEREDLDRIQEKAKDVVDLAPTLDILDEVAKRRSRQSINIEQQWNQEMLALEQERLKELQKTEQETLEDEAIQNLDKELESLIRDKEVEAKLAHQEGLLRAEREKEEEKVREEERRKEKERRENMSPSEAEKEFTIEEWIAYMEEKKKKGMTQAQQEEYERRKQARREQERQRQERLQREEEEKKRKTRETMEKEMTSYRQRQLEVAESRLTEAELKQKQEEAAQRQLEESKLRKERGVRMRREDKEREMEEHRPKARSALAARWEESVKSRSNGKEGRALHKSTVMTGVKVPAEKGLSKEEERLIRRISGGYPNGSVKIATETNKRKSLDSDVLMN